MFRPSRNFKVPQVYGGQWKNHQTFQKWDPIGKRLIQVNCCSPAGPAGGGGLTGPCTPPDPISGVILSNLTATGGFIELLYTPNSEILIASVYESATLPVDTSGVPLDVYTGVLPPAPSFYSFTTTPNYYYTVAVRVQKDCGGGNFVYSPYVYADPVQYIVSSGSYQFVRASTGVGVNPGTGNFSSNLTSPPNVVVNFNKTDSNLADATAFLSIIGGTANTLTITKDPSNYSVFTINSSTDAGTYWSFACTISSFLGTVNVGDTITLTYTTPVVNYQFVRASTGVGVNPGTGNFSSNLTSPPNLVVNFNKTDANAVDATAYLLTISGTATTITITKNPSNYSVFTVNSSTDVGAYWSFACTISSFLGTVNFGDTITLTYT